MDINNLPHLLSTLEALFKQERIKELLYGNEDRPALEPNPALVSFLLQHQVTLITYYQQLQASNQLEKVAAFFSRKVMEGLLKTNQFLQFKEHEIHSFEGLYLQLLHELFHNNLDETSIHQSIQEHYRRIRLFLFQTNPSALPFESIEITKVPCSEYTALFQSDVLHLDRSTLQEPILDIGCGKEAHLVRHLRTLGYQAWGLDRLALSDDAWLKRAHWFAYTFEKNTWGTILSHMAFSHHFRYHHFHHHPEIQEYAKVYRSILEALQPGGMFIYSPDLPFIEEHLDRAQYEVETFLIFDQLKTTKVRRRI